MEELKLIIEELAKLGVEAKSAFVVWVVAKYLCHYVTVLVICGGVLTVVYKLVRPVVDNMSFIGQIKQIMGISGDLYLSGKNTIIETLIKGKKKGE